MKKYTFSQRLYIGKEVASYKLSKLDAAVQFERCEQTIDNYVKLYKASTDLKTKKKYSAIAAENKKLKAAIKALMK